MNTHPISVRGGSPLPPLPVETRCLHGVAGDRAPARRRGRCDLVRRERERGRVTISSDPNVRPALAATDDETLISLLDRAATVAAITCSRPGADPPTRSEVDAILAGRR